MKACLVRIYGKVQGVFFRASLKQTADQHGVHGWVRNRTDGTVEAHLQGAEAQVAKILEWAARGPDQAEVSEVKVDDTTPITSKGFTIDKSA